MRPMLVRDINEGDIYINPKHIESMRADHSCRGDLDRTIITFVSGDTIVIQECVYDFIQDLRKN